MVRVTLAVLLSTFVILLNFYNQLNSVEGAILDVPSDVVNAFGDAASGLIAEPDEESTTTENEEETTTTDEAEESNSDRKAPGKEGKHRCTKEECPVSLFQILQIIRPKPSVLLGTNGRKVFKIVKRAQESDTCLSESQVKIIVKLLLDC